MILMARSARRAALPKACVSPVNAPTQPAITTISTAPIFLPMPSAADGTAKSIRSDWQRGRNPYPYGDNNPFKNTDPMGLETPTVTLGLPPFGSGTPTVLKSCLATCLGELLASTSPDMGKDELTSMYLATPIPKKVLGYPRSLGSGAYTTLGSELAMLGRKLPRLPFDTLGSANACRVLAGANEVAAAGAVAFNLAAMGSCTAICASQ